MTPIILRVCYLGVHNLVSLNRLRSVCVNIYTTKATTMYTSSKHVQLCYCVSSHEVHW